MQRPLYFSQQQQQRRRRPRRHQTHQNSRQHQQPSGDRKRPTYPIKASDYDEIFGGSSYSIPVLDLPPAPSVKARSSFFRTSSTIDYLDIFGGFADSGFGVPYEEILNCDSSASSPNGGPNEGTKHDVFESSQTSNFNGGTEHPKLSYQPPGSGIRQSATNGVEENKGLDCSSVQLNSNGDNLNAEDTSANEQYHSCSSTDQSTLECSNGVILEDSFFAHSASSPTSSSSSTKSSKADVRGVSQRLTTKFPASEGISHQQQQMPEFDTGKLEKNTSKKTTMANSSDSMIKNAEGHDQRHVKSFSNSSTSSFVSDKADTNTRFVTVSDINLRTQPSAVPPPARPPPRVCNNSEGGIKAESLKPTVTVEAYCLDKNVYMPTSSKEANGNFSITGSNKAPPFFDVDVGSAAAASVAAMREAMEQAQTRLKSAKVSMERKKENPQNWKKLATKVKERKLNETVPVTEINNQKITQEASESDRRPKIIGVGNVVPDLEANERYFDLAEESLRRKEAKEIAPTQVSYIQDEREGKWKVEEQFFELVNNDNKSTRVQQVFEDDSNDKKPKVHPKPKEDKADKKTTKLAPELKMNDFVIDAGDCEFNHRDAKLKEGSKIAAVEETKEAPKTILDECSQEIDEKVDAILSEGLLEEDKTQPQEDVKLRDSDELCISTVSEMRLNEVSENRGTDALAESESEEKKSLSFEEIHVYEELVNVTDTTSNESISADDDSKLNPSSKLLQPHENETGIEVPQESHFCEHVNHSETTDACEEDECGIQEKKPLAEDDVMPSDHDKCESKPTESEKKIEDCSLEQNEEKINDIEKNTACMYTVDENETKKRNHWQYFCDKIIKEAQQGGGEEEQEPAKLDDEQNIMGNTDTGHGEDNMVCEVVSNAQEKSSMKGAAQVVFQSVVTEMELDNSLRNTVLDHNGETKKTTKEFLKVQHSDGSEKDKSSAVTLTNEDSRREKMVKRDREREEQMDRKLEEEKERKREREKDRLAFEKAYRETCDREMVEARRRAAEKAAVERANSEARQRALIEAREKASVEAERAEKTKREARLRAERAAVERVTAEARKRAAEKAIQEAREREEHERVRNAIYREVRDQQRKDSGMRQNPQNDSDVYPGRNESETPMRQKARLERTKRTHERARRALEQKNQRDVMSQREVEERERISSTLDADIRRWSNGKEGNLRALLSTLQYILGPESKWKPISLTDIITAGAVKTAYKKSTLCVHPDKLQQRDASVRDKYIAEKVFELLTNAWYKFNSEER